MNRTLPTILDAPEKQIMGVSLIYSFFCYFSIPFLLLLVNLGLENNYVAQSWIEVFYHLLNAVVIIRLFREYLSFSWFTVGTVKREVITTALITGGVMLMSVAFWQMCYVFGGSYISFVGSYGTLPVTETEALLVSSGVVECLPLVGTLLLTGIIPVVTCCMCYATVFPAGYNVRPWLGYLLVILLTAFPRFCSGFTHWVPTEQLCSFLVRLPIHMVSCWASRKTDTIWTPIFAHMGVNLIASLILIFTPY